MRKLLIILGSIFCVILVMAGVGVAALMYWGPELDRESAVYAESSIRAIASSWNEAALMDRASPELKQAGEGERLDRAFDSFRRLGVLQACEKPQGEARMSITLKRGIVVLAEYTAQARFENAATRIRIGLIRHKQWQIISFYVDSGGRREE